MSGETWPKEEQRMCNGASGQVPVMAGDYRRADGWLDLEWLRLPPAPDDTATPVHKAMDAADSMLAESLDMAQHVIGHSPAVRREVLALAKAHFQSATMVYAVNQIVAVLRELTPEIAGAISEAGTDIGAGILGCIQQALTPNT